MPVNFQNLSYFLIISFLTLLVGCATSGVSDDKGFSYSHIPISQETAHSGEGNHIQFRGTALPLSGSAIREGDTLQSVHVTKSDLSLVDISDTHDKVRIISVVPSLDTKVCEQQTHYLSEKNEGLDQHISLLTISIDTPFAQSRFAQEAHIDNVVFLSDYRGGEFGRSHGLLLEGPHVLARAVMVVDQQNVIRYLQVTPDLGQLPDMEAAFHEARRLVKTP